MAIESDIVRYSESTDFLAPVFQKSVPIGKYTMIVQGECSSNVLGSYSCHM